MEKKTPKKQKRKQKKQHDQPRNPAKSSSEMKERKGEIGWGRGLRSSSGVENWRWPVGLLLNFPLPMASKKLRKEVGKLKKERKSRSGFRKLRESDEFLSPPPAFLGFSGTTNLYIYTHYIYRKNIPTQTPKLDASMAHLY